MTPADILACTLPGCDCQLCQRFRAFAEVVDAAQHLEEVRTVDRLEAALARVEALPL